MSSLTATVIWILSTLTLFGQILIVFLIAMLLAKKFASPKSKVQKIVNLISENYLLIILVISAMSTAGSLTLSEIANFAPCKLCWYQRIAMYPEFVISLVAVITNDIKVKKYILPIAVIGGLVSIYHILLQIFPNVLQCNDEVAKCSAVQFAGYGYITIPIMSGTAFLILILASLFAFNFGKKK